MGIDIGFLIYAACAFGCGVTGYISGRNKGIENTLVWLESEGIIEFTQDEDE